MKSRANPTVGLSKNQNESVTVCMGIVTRVDIPRNWCLRTFNVQQSQQDYDDKIISLQGISPELFDHITDPNTHKFTITKQNWFTVFEIALKNNIQIILNEIGHFFQDATVSRICALKQQQQQPHQVKIVHDIFKKYFFNQHLNMLFKAQAPSIEELFAMIGNPEFKLALHSIIQYTTDSGSSSTNLDVFSQVLKRMLLAKLFHEYQIHYQVAHSLISYILCFLVV